MALFDDHHIYVPVARARRQRPVKAEGLDETPHHGFRRRPDDGRGIKARQAGRGGIETQGQFVLSAWQVDAVAGEAAGEEGRGEVGRRQDVKVEQQRIAVGVAGRTSARPLDVAHLQGGGHTGPVDGLGRAQPQAQDLLGAVAERRQFGLAGWHQEPVEAVLYLGASEADAAQVRQAREALRRGIVQCGETVSHRRSQTPGHGRGGELVGQGTGRGGRCLLAFFLDPALAGGDGQIGQPAEEGRDPSPRRLRPARTAGLQRGRRAYSAR